MTARTALLVCALPTVAVLAGCGHHTAAAVTTPVSTTGSASMTPSRAGSAPVRVTTSAPPTSTSHTTSPSATALAPTGPCRTGQLSVSLGTHATSQDRTTYALILRNTAAAPCTVTGYPAVDLLESGGMQAGPAAADLVGDAPSGHGATVVLGTGQSASANLSYVAAADGGSDCDPAPVAALLVFAPDQSASVSVPWASSVCTDDADRAGVTVVVAG